MQNNFDVTVELDVHAPIDEVWNAFVDPAIIKQYMFGTDTVSDWKEGSPITWKGEWEGKPFEDAGTVLKIEAPHMLQYQHTSGGSRNKVTVELMEQGGNTHVVLTQDDNKTEESAASSKKNWEMMLGGMKKVVEKA